MNKYLVWIAGGIVAVGLVLPWATFRATLSGNYVGGGTVAGYEYIQSLLAIGISVIGIVVSMQLKKKSANIALMTSGVLVVIVTATALMDLRGPVQTMRVNPPEIQFPPGTPAEIRDASRRARANAPEARISANPNIGIFVTMLGGILLVVSGATGLRPAESKSERSDEKEVR